MNLVIILAAITIMNVAEQTEFCKSNEIHLTSFTTPSNTPPNTTKFSIVGLFPSMATLKERYNPSGYVWMEVAKFALAEINRMLSLLPIPVVLEMIVYDTCNSIEIAESALLETLLNSTDTSITNCNHCCNLTKKYNNILGVVGPASSSTTDAIYKMLLPYQIPLISYSATSVRFDDKELYPMFMRTIPPDNLQAKMIVDILLKFKWTYVSLVYNDNEYGRMGYQELKKLFEDYNICTAFESSFEYNKKNNKLVDKEMNAIIRAIQDDKKSNVVILWASGPITRRFLQHNSTLTVYHKTWIVTESVSTNPHLVHIDKKVVHGLLSIVPFAGIYDNFEREFRRVVYTTQMRENLWLKNLFAYNLNLNETNLNGATINKYWQTIPLTKNGNVRNAVYAYGKALQNYISSKINCSTSKRCTISSEIDRIHFFESFLKKVKFHGLSNESSSFNEKGNIHSAMFHLYSLQQQNNLSNLVWKKIGYWNQTDSLQITTDQFTWSNNSNIPPNSRCADSECGQGYYAILHGSQEKKCCWSCVKCKQGFIKANKGNHECQPCPSGTNSNKMNTECLIIQDVYIYYYDTKAITLYLVISATSMIAFIFIIIFILFRKTPIVISSQYHISLLQLTSLMILPLCNLLYIGKPTKVMCTARISTIGVLLSVVYSFTLIKTQKLIKVFRANLVLSQNKRRMTMPIAVWMILFLVCTNAALLTAFYTYDPFDVTVSEISDLHIHLDCNTKEAFYSQILYVLLLAVICGIQAFRARQLPHNYNETRLITFAMFASILVLFIIFPLYESAEHATNATFIGCLLVVIADILVLLIMYSYKIWIILAKPYRNTSIEFHKNRLRSVERKISEAMVRKHALSDLSCFDEKDLERSRSESQLTLTETYGGLQINTSKSCKADIQPQKSENSATKPKKYNNKVKEKNNTITSQESDTSNISSICVKDGVSMYENIQSTSFRSSKQGDLYY